MEILIGLVRPFIPSQLYYVKRHAKPKASVSTLVAVTTAVLAIGLATFVALFVTQSNSYSTETTIEVADKSDSGWTCSMASVVTQSYTVSSSTEPVEYYNLMNINELKSDCFTALQQADPCSSKANMMYTIGSTSPVNGLFVQSPTAATATSNNNFYFSVAPPESRPTAIMAISTYRFNIDDGSLTQGQLGGYYYYNFPAKYVDYLSSSTAMTTDGRGIFVTYEAENSYGLSYFDGMEASWDYYLAEHLLLTNDNYHNVLVLMISNSTSGFENSLYYFDSDINNHGASLTELLSFDTAGAYAIVQFGVFNTNSSTAIPRAESLFVYYMFRNSDDYFGNLYCLHNGISTLLVPAEEQSGISAIQVSAFENKVFAMYYASNRTYTSTLWSVDSAGNQYYYPVVIPRSGVTSFAVINNETSVFYTLEMGDYPLVVQDMNSTTFLPVLSGFEGTVSGWFVCGDQLVTSGLPANIYSSDCNNGISWQLQYTTSGYYTTKSDFAEKATTDAFNQCNTSLYSTICNRVGSLPPYICSKKVYLPFFTVFATAIANAHLLTVVLFVTSGFLLSKLNRDSIHEVTSKETKDVAMTNPMRSVPEEMPSVPPSA